MVANEFGVKQIRFSEENKTIYIGTDEGSNLLCPYTFFCRSKGIIVAFNFDKYLMTVILPNSTGVYTHKYIGYTMKFWLHEDLPTPALQWFTNWKEIMASIEAEYKDKMSTYLLDNIINS